MDGETDNPRLLTELTGLTSHDILMLRILCRSKNRTKFEQQVNKIMRPLEDIRGRTQLRTIQYILSRIERNERILKAYEN